MPKPEEMREAVARYVEEIHRAYLAQALTFPAAVRGRMPLLAPGPLTVAAVGVRNLHVLATRDPLGPVRGPEVEMSGSLDGLSWTLRFFDPVVLPSLALVDESSEPAFGEVRHALGVTTVVYHFVAYAGRGAFRAQRGARGDRAGGRALGRGQGLRDDPQPGARARGPGGRDGRGGGGRAGAGARHAGGGYRAAQRGRCPRWRLRGQAGSGRGAARAAGRGRGADAVVATLGSPRRDRL